MAEPEFDLLKGRRFLLVEDEYVAAADLAQTLEEVGAEIIGPVGTVEEALALALREGSSLDAAVLDINLHEERVFPVADVLAKAGIPFVFATGYDEKAIPPLYASVPRCEKPVSKAELARLLFAASGPGGRA